MARPRICVSIAAPEAERAAEAIRGVEAHEPDLVELRIDRLRNRGGFEGIRVATDLPLIATNRRRDQGGLHDGPEDARIAELMEACDAGFDHVDLELTTPSLGEVSERFREKGVKVIASFHNLEGTPTRGEMEEVLRRERDLGPVVCKIVGTAASYADNLAYLGFLEENRGVGLVCFGMGRPGAISRVLSPLFGGAFTYASAARGSESAPGQLTIASLKEVYRRLGAWGS